MERDQSLREQTAEVSRIIKNLWDVADRLDAVADNIDAPYIPISRRKDA